MGLNNAYIAHHPEKRDLDYIFAQHPRYVQLHIAINDSGVIAAPHKEIYTQILAHPQFQSCYRLYLDSPQEDYFPFFYVRICE